MKTAIIILTAAALTSCGLPLPDGSNLETRVGWFAPALPGDPSAEFGAFTGRVAPVVVSPEK